MKKISYLSLLIPIGLLLLPFISFSQTVNSVTTGYRVIKNAGPMEITATVNSGQVCQKITNNSDEDYFAPTKYVTDWVSFVNNLPSGISVSDCCTQIGAQCWTNNVNSGTMLGSIASIPTTNSSIEKWCYDNNEANCTTYGGLYNFTEVVETNICPAGFHVPSSSEISTLYSYCSGDVNCVSGNQAQPGGYAVVGSSYTGSGYSYIWYSDSGYPGMYMIQPSIAGPYAGYSGSYGFSVRCLQSSSGSCSSGQYMVGGICVDCPVGHYCPSGMKTECPRGTYNPNKASTSSSACQACGAGLTSSAGSDSSSDCVPVTCTTIGSYCWMDDYVNSGTMILSGTMPANNSTVEKWCYNNSEANCATSGALYTIGEATGYSTAVDNQGICPSGYHVPTAAEFVDLAAAGSSAIINSFQPKYPGFNSSGSSFTAMGTYEYLWATDQNWHYMYSTNPGVLFNNGSTNPSHGMSLRCVKDPITCAAGYYNNSGVCSICPAGSYCSSNHRNLCPVNTYNPDTGSSSVSACQACPSSYPSSSAGSDAIGDCIATACTVVGTYCWMDKYVNVGTMLTTGQTMSNNGTVEKYCYNDQSANCETYGGLYVEQETMNYDVSIAQGICPAGFHVPTPAEFTNLYNAGSAAVASLFKPLYGGYFHPTTSFYGAMGTYDCLWGSDMLYRYIGSSGQISSSGNNGGGNYAMSLRCVKNISGTCSAGYYDVSGTCTICTAGYYCPGDGLAYPCGANNQYSYQGASACSAISCGYYTTGGGTTTRTGYDTCPSNYYCTGDGYYSSCDSGYTSPAGSCSSSSCTSSCSCSAGYYGSGSCSECGGNQYYCPGDCSYYPVSSGYYTTGGGATTRTSQSQCTAGTYCSGGVQNTCSAGTYSSAGSSSCYSCGAGANNSAGSPCSCSAGYYLSDGVCQQCPVGSYCTGDNTATSCGANLSSPAGSDSSSDCYPTGCICSAGYFLSGSTCYACSAGSYCPGDCSAYTCAGGTYNTSTGMSYCATCPGGFYCSGGTNINQCEPGFYCPSGSYTYTTNPCPAPNIVSNAGSDASSDCRACAEGTFYFSPTGLLDADACYTCWPGAYCTGGALYTCPSGTYNSSSGSSSSSACQQCPADSYCDGAEAYCSSGTPGCY